MRVARLLALLAVLSGTSAAEGQTILPPSPRATVGVTGSAAPFQQVKKPFANLFAGELQPPANHRAEVALAGPVQLTVPRSNPGPRIVCGMTLVPMDPEFDAAMPRMVPDKNTTFTIRLVPPRVCRQ